MACLLRLFLMYFYLERTIITTLGNKMTFLPSMRTVYHGNESLCSLRSRAKNMGKNRQIKKKMSPEEKY